MNLSFHVKTHAERREYSLGTKDLSIDVEGYGWVPVCNDDSDQEC